MTSNPTPTCAMCSSAWSMDILSIDSMSCCRGTGNPQSLSRPEATCETRTLTVGCKRPGLAHLFGGALANHIGFLRAWEDLRWRQDTSSTKHDGHGGQLTWRRGAEAVSLARNIAGSIG